MLALAEQVPLVYRLFYTNSAGQIRAVAETIHAIDDGDALRQAEAIARGRRAEVWSGARRVAMLNGAERR